MPFTRSNPHSTRGSNQNPSSTKETQHNSKAKQQSTKATATKSKATSRKSKATSKKLKATPKTIKATSKKSQKPQSQHPQSDDDFDTEDEYDEEQDDAYSLKSDHSIIQPLAQQQILDQNRVRDRSAQNNQNASTKKTIFRSQFPGFEMDNYEDFLDDWTVDELRENIAKQGSRSSKAPKDVKSLVKTIRLEYEKRMLMAALMGGVPEVVVWNIVGEGPKKGKANPWMRFKSFCPLALAEQMPSRDDKKAWSAYNTKLSDIWNGFTVDQRDVFKDPLFLSLSNLPDLLDVPLENEDGAELGQDATSVAPAVHKLTEDERLKYQPLFDDLVDVEKLQLSRGKPDTSKSIATLQQRSLSELKKAHHTFVVVCQQYQITYYLAAVSCGSIEGWSQVYSNNTLFAQWALNDAQVPSTLRSYVHGISAAKIVESGKMQQPSDERKSRLGKELNALVATAVKPIYII
ncbi:uncharacterized protein MELLADRAFT_85890 [Melampsora larici-populina 98AG31]|uniref:Uncharacterized protein n=1 Tax=Melampsora larici-populina (strain 98AG31 / pathotype 3-4-7) TaxID=747676 RepID=F4RK10_MELLP|nr:uncharacterized protein MELLADRAFT_85890 [Melampsora larici-populina 98AG31]EGG07268.1 hypothetical protein MELLADRAFT_85890 [Melampsora larici-populina 98AG31]